jgi:L-aminopeptidase/D-esterase-like protein
MNLSFTSIPGLRVGHAHDLTAGTGCTVILCEAGATVGVDQRGGAPGTRETDLARPMHLVQQVHAVVLTGGSAFGLDCVGGVVRYLEEHGAGFDVGVARVPIVPAACLFDLSFGDAKVRPTPEMSYAACQAASSEPVAEGNVGAGAGATVGKALGMGQAMKAGLGCAAIQLPSGAIVAAIAAVNAFGDVLDPSTGAIVAGTRSLVMGDARIGAGPLFADSLALLGQAPAAGFADPPPTSNTVIGVVATNVPLSKEETNKVAQMAHDGLARAIRPAHTMWDGDTIFALSMGALQIKADVSTIGAYAAEMFAQACLRAATQTAPLGGLPSVSSLG